MITPAADANVCIRNNEYLINTTFTEPVTLGTLPTSMRSFELTDYGSTFGGVGQFDRVYDKTISGSTEDLLAVIAVNERFAGVVEYTLFGNDGSNAANGHHAASGYFTFRRASGGATTVYNHVRSYSHTYGTLGSNTVDVGQFAPNCWLQITNTHTGSVKYSARVKVLMRFVET